MTNLSLVERDRIRAILTRVVEQLKTDPSFADKIRENPTATLMATGLRERTVVGLLHEADAVSEFADFSDYLMHCPVSEPVSTPYDVSGHAMFGVALCTYTTYNCPSAPI